MVNASAILAVYTYSVVKMVVGLTLSALVVAVGSLALSLSTLAGHCGCRMVVMVGLHHQLSAGGVNVGLLLILLVVELLSMVLVMVVVSINVCSHNCPHYGC